MIAFRRIIKLLGIAIVLLFFVSYFIVPKLLSTPARSKVGDAALDIAAFNSALALYYVDSDSQFPKTTLLQLLSDNVPGWAGPYMATITKDPWDNAYTYTSDGSNYTIISIHQSEYRKSETVRYIFSTGVMESLP